MARTTARARVFWNGRSQAVRLPKEFRVEGDEVLVHREGDRIILEPVTRPRFSDEFWALFGAFGDDFDLGDRDAAGRQERELDFGRDEP